MFSHVFRIKYVNNRKKSNKQNSVLFKITVILNLLLLQILSTPQRIKLSFQFEWRECINQLVDSIELQ